MLLGELNLKISSKIKKLLFETKPFHHLLENLPLAILDHILHKLMLQLLSQWSSIHCQILVTMKACSLHNK